MDFIRELLTEKRRSSKKKPGTPKDGKHDDGTSMMFNKDRPYVANPKKPEFSLGNMYFDMTKPSDRAGMMESTSQRLTGSFSNFLISHKLTEWQDDKYFKFVAWADRENTTSAPKTDAVKAYDVSDAKRKAKALNPKGSVGDVTEIDQAQFEKMVKSA